MYYIASLLTRLSFGTRGREHLLLSPEDHFAKATPLYAPHSMTPSRRYTHLAREDLRVCINLSSRPARRHNGGYTHRHILCLFLWQCLTHRVLYHLHNREVALDDLTIIHVDVVREECRIEGTAM